MRDFAFCRQFSLNRSRLSKMAIAIAEDNQVTDPVVAQNMGVNEYMVTGFRGWLRKTGLGHGTSGNYHLSSWGEVVIRYDPMLNDIGTQWLLHFHLGTHHEERAEVWYQFFNNFAQPYQTFTADQWRTTLTRSIDDLPQNKSAITKDANELLKTYTRHDTLGQLGLVRKVQGDEYITAATLPPPLIGAFMLLDTWERHFSTTDTIRISNIVQDPEMVGKLCIADRHDIHTLLNQIQSIGLIAIADTQHEPVTRRFRESPVTLIEQYYQSL